MKENRLHLFWQAATPLLREARLVWEEGSPETNQSQNVPKEQLPLGKDIQDWLKDFKDLEKSALRKHLQEFLGNNGIVNTKELDDLKQKTQKGIEKLSDAQGLTVKQVKKLMATFPKTHRDLVSLVVNWEAKPGEEKGLISREAYESILKQAGAKKAGKTGVPQSPGASPQQGPSSPYLQKLSGQLQMLQTSPPPPNARQAKLRGAAITHLRQEIAKNEKMSEESARRIREGNARAASPEEGAIRIRYDREHQRTYTQHYDAKDGWVKDGDGKTTAEIRKEAERGHDANLAYLAERKAAQYKTPYRTASLNQQDDIRFGITPTSIDAKARAAMAKHGPKYSGVTGEQYKKIYDDAKNALAYTPEQLRKLDELSAKNKKEVEEHWKSTRTPMTFEQHRAMMEYGGKGDVENMEMDKDGNLVVHLRGGTEKRFSPNGYVIGRFESAVLEPSGLWSGQEAKKPLEKQAAPATRSEEPTQIPQETPRQSAEAALNSVMQALRSATDKEAVWVRPAMPGYLKVLERSLNTDEKVKTILSKTNEEIKGMGYVFVFEKGVLSVKKIETAKQEPVNVKEEKEKADRTAILKEGEKRTIKARETLPIGEGLSIERNENKEGNYIIRLDEMIWGKTGRIGKEITPPGWYFDPAVPPLETSFVDFTGGDWEIEKTHTGCVLREDQKKVVEVQLHPENAQVIVAREGKLILFSWSRKNSSPNQPKPKEKAVEKSLKEKLETPLSAVFQEEPLFNVLTKLSEQAGIPIRGDYKDLAEEGLAVDSPISINLPNDLPLKSILNNLRDYNISWRVKDDEVEIVSIVEEKKRGGEIPSEKTLSEEPTNIETSIATKLEIPITFEKVGTLEEVMDALSRQTGVNILIDGLDGGEGNLYDKSLNITSANKKLKELLKEILSPFDVGYIVKNDVLRLRDISGIHMLKAEYGYIEVQLDIGKSYLNSEFDHEYALPWLTLAKEGGSKEAAELLEKLALEKHEVVRAEQELAELREAMKIPKKRILTSEGWIEPKAVEEMKSEKSDRPLIWSGRLGDKLSETNYQNAYTIKDGKIEGIVVLNSLNKIYETDETKKVVDIYLGKVATSKCLEEVKIAMEEILQKALPPETAKPEPADPEEKKDEEKPKNTEVAPETRREIRNAIDRGMDALSEGNDKKAAKAFEKARTHAETLLGDFEADRQRKGGEKISDSEIADVEYLCGWAAELQGKFEDAKNYFEDAVKTAGPSDRWINRYELALARVLMKLIPKQDKDPSKPEEKKDESSTEDLDELEKEAKELEEKAKSEPQNDELLDEAKKLEEETLSSDTKEQKERPSALFSIRDTENPKAESREEAIAEVEKLPYGTKIFEIKAMAAFVKRFPLENIPLETRPKIEAWSNLLSRTDIRREERDSQLTLRITGKDQIVDPVMQELGLATTLQLRRDVIALSASNVVGAPSGFDKQLISYASRLPPHEALYVLTTELQSFLKEKIHVDLPKTQFIEYLFPTEIPKNMPIVSLKEINERPQKITLKDGEFMAIKDVPIPMHAGSWAATEYAGLDAYFIHGEKPLNGKSPDVPFYQRRDSFYPFLQSKINNAHRITHSPTIEQIPFNGAIREDQNSNSIFMNDAISLVYNHGVNVKAERRGSSIILSVGGGTADIEIDKRKNVQTKPTGEGLVPVEYHNQFLEISVSDTR